MKKEFLFNDLHAVIWKNEDKVVTKIIHVIHGMTEHIHRYEQLANILIEEGVMVIGYDLRGHGKNTGDLTCATFGMNGWNQSIDDIHLFYEMIHKDYPNVPYYLLGFSLGSFLLREYFTKYNDDITGAIIMGTGHQPAFILNIIMKLVHNEIKKVGYDATTDFVRNLSFGQYNKKFKPNRTKMDWLCANEDQLDKYMNDNLCRKDISAGLFYDLLNSMKKCGLSNTYENWNKQMPVLLISGNEDSVGDHTKGIQKLYKKMKQEKLNIQIKIIQNARHDLLHEASALETIHMIQNFIK